MAGPLTDSDPHSEGMSACEIRPLDDGCGGAAKAARIVSRFASEARAALIDEEAANGVLLRGISSSPDLPSFEQRFSLRAASLAIHPLYQGLAQVLGMHPEEGLKSIEDQFDRYLEVYDRYDYFFIHYRYSDVYGFDRNFDAKKKAIEVFDEALPRLMKKRPDVLAITGDHSSPCIVQGHSWHPQPVLLNSPFSGSDKLDRFTETSANLGSLGVFEAKYLIRLMQANARMFGKYGA